MVSVHQALSFLIDAHQVALINTVTYDGAGSGRKPVGIFHFFFMPRSSFEPPLETRRGWGCWGSGLSGEEKVVLGTRRRRMVAEKSSDVSEVEAAPEITPDAGGIAGRAGHTASVDVTSSTFVYGETVLDEAG